MSYYLMLNKWEGEDQDYATEKVSKVFRMDPHQASDIVENLSGGNPWQFEHQVSNDQSEVAETYLNSLGFEVERIPIIEDDFDFDSNIENEVETIGKKPGMFSKMWGALTKKR